MKRIGMSLLSKLGLPVAIGLVTGGVLLAQQPDAAIPQAVSVMGSLQALQSQVLQLGSALRDMQAETVQSRAEARELRQELQETREQLNAFRQELGQMHQPSVGTDAVSGPESSVAQDSPPRATGAAEGLARVQEDQQLLGAKVDDQYQTKVESGSKYRVRLSGIALLNVFSNRGAVNNVDIPTLAVDRTSLDSNSSFGATVRQSSLGLEVFGPTVAGARSSAQIQVDFFGGFPNTIDGIAAGLVRLRVATARFDWPHTSVIAGQDVPFFSPLYPTSLASLSYPALAYSGNLWTWTPQVRIERRVTLPNKSSLLIQGGILDPLTGEPPYVAFYRVPQAGERTGQPGYAARIAWTSDVMGHEMTFGAGGYYSRQNWSFDRNVDAWAGTADWSVPLGRGFSLTGEFYRGRAIGGLGGGSGRSVLFNGNPTLALTSVLGLDVAGGWSQLKFKPTDKLEFNGAFGEDYPFAADLKRFPVSLSYVNASTGRNESAFVNSIYHARSNLLLSLEYRRLSTWDLYQPRENANHVNLGIGVLF